MTPTKSRATTTDELTAQHQKPAIRVDFYNNFLGLGEDGQYHPIPPSQITLVIDGTNKVYTFGSTGAVVMNLSGFEAQARSGDRLVIGADGSHQLLR